jgi:hypothetical protein
MADLTCLKFSCLRRHYDPRTLYGPARRLASGRRRSVSALASIQVPDFIALGGNPSDKLRALTALDLYFNCNGCCEGSIAYSR